MTQVRYCPECDEEFRPDIVVCSDCGGPLRLQEEGAGDVPEGGVGEADHTLDDVPVQDLSHLTTASSMEAFEAIAATLGASEVPSRVVVQSGAYAVFVRPTDLAAAGRALAAARESPAASESDAPAATGFDAATGRYLKCPACGADAPGESCSECGLELSADREAP